MKRYLNILLVLVLFISCKNINQFSDTKYVTLRFQAEIPASVARKVFIDSSELKYELFIDNKLCFSELTLEELEVKQIENVSVGEHSFLINAKGQNEVIVFQGLTTTEIDTDANIVTVLLEPYENSGTEKGSLDYFFGLFEEYSDYWGDYIVKCQNLILTLTPLTESGTPITIPVTETNILPEDLDDEYFNIDINNQFNDNLKMKYYRVLKDNIIPGMYYLTVTGRAVGYSYDTENPEDLSPDRNYPANDDDPDFVFISDTVMITAGVVNKNFTNYHDSLVKYFGLSEDGSEAQLFKSYFTYCEPEGITVDGYYTINLPMLFLNNFKTDPQETYIYAPSYNCYGDYRFFGWFLDPEFTKPVFYYDKTISNECDIKLYPKFVKAEPKVLFNYNHGEKSISFTNDITAVNVFGIRNVFSTSYKDFAIGSSNETEMNVYTYSYEMLDYTNSIGQMNLDSSEVEKEFTDDRIKDGSPLCVDDKKTDGQEDNIYFYIINNNGTNELCAKSKNTETRVELSNDFYVSRMATNFEDLLFLLDSSNGNIRVFGYSLNNNEIEINEIQDCIHEFKDDNLGIIKLPDYNYNATDIIFTEDSLYVLFMIHIVSSPGKKIISTGCIKKYNVSETGEITLDGNWNDWGLDESQIDRETIYNHAFCYETLFLTTPEHSTSQTFFGPVRFIACKPKKLVIADTGMGVWVDDEGGHLRYENRIVEIDLEKKTFSSQETNCNFANDEDSFPPQEISSQFRSSMSEPFIGNGVYSSELQTMYYVGDF